MSSPIFAYNIAELEKKLVLDESRNLYKSKVLSEEQWLNIRMVYSNTLYTPNVFMKVLLFVVSLVGMSTLMGPIALIFGNIGEGGYRFVSFLLGVSLLLFTDQVLIRSKSHYKSGITEAGIFSGIAFIAFALLGTGNYNMIVYPIIGLMLAGFAAIRYLNLTALVFSLVFLVWIIFQILSNIGGLMQALMPFIFMTFFGFLYWQSTKLRVLYADIIFVNQFVIIQTFSLIIFYVAGNYFVVRELSVNMLNMSMAAGGDIPFAIVFYALTALLPFAFLYWSIKGRSILFFRVSLITLALSVITFKYYFSLGMPVVTITLAGAVLILLSLYFLNFLKQSRNGFTRELLIQEKWNSKDLMAIVASQTLGGSRINVQGNDDTPFGGGKFGGGGAGGNWE